MKKHIDTTATPLHIAILHTGTQDHIRASLESIRNRAGYPHSVSVVNMADDVDSQYFLHAMHTAGIVNNLITTHTPVAPVVPLMQTLASVEAPYALVFTSGTIFEKQNWLAAMLEQLIHRGIPALSGIAADNGEHVLSPILNPHHLSSQLCQAGNIILTTRAALERLDVFTHRGIETFPLDMPHSADIAARETRRTAVQNLH